jgi:hypothetical protein
MQSLDQGLLSSPHIRLEATSTENSNEISGVDGVG